jgi:hypothetical protein
MSPTYLRVATISLLNLLHYCLDGLEEWSQDFQPGPENDC